MTFEMSSTETRIAGPRRGRILRRTVAALLLALLLAGGGLAWLVHAVPLDPVPDRTARAPAVLVEAADGTPLGWRGEFRGAPATREALPDHLVQAVLAIEDRRFYDHGGIDLRGIARATWRNLRANGIVEGGSTITQQLAKIQFLSSERTMRRKAVEALTALRLEAQLSKDEILMRYLNNLYFGGGAVGITAAARAYFDKDTAELTVAESAMLAGIIRAPSRAHALHNLEEAQARAGVVLNAMVETGALTPEEARVARAAPATPNANAPSRVGGGWFADWILGEAVAMAGPEIGSVTARTTLRPELQAAAERVTARLLRDAPGAALKEVALVAMTPDGAVVAMVGGRDYGASQFNRAVQARRQPGSSFKLFVYLAGLRNGMGLSDALQDSAVEIGGWRPQNIDGRYRGAVPMEAAFAQSLNAATVRLAQQVGLPEVIRAARDLGIDAPLEPHPSIALGTAELDLLDLTGAYASVAAGRMPAQPWAITSLASMAEGGGLLATRPQPATAPLDHRAELLRLLEGVVRQGTGRRAALNGLSAGKTGTSQGNRDAWFVGFTDQLVAGVWVGHDDDSAMPGMTGGDLPARIWQAFMAEATGLAPLERVPAAVASEAPAARVHSTPVQAAPVQMARQPAAAADRLRAPVRAEGRDNRPRAERGNSRNAGKGKAKGSKGRGGGRGKGKGR